MSGDKNYLVYGDNTDPIIINSQLIAPELNGYQDVLKLSHAKNVVIHACTIAGGSEDCIDMNRGCENITVQLTHFDSRGKYCMTIKDTKNVLIDRCVIHVHGSETDIDLGNWTDTSTARTTGIVLDNVNSLDGEPVKVRVGNADWPKIIGGNVKIDYVGSYLLKAYWWTKFLWTKITN